MKKEIHKRLSWLKTDVSSGCSELATQALVLTRDAAFELLPGDPNGLIEFASTVQKSRPGMAAVGNIIKKFTSQAVGDLDTSPGQIYINISHDINLARYSVVENAIGIINCISPDAIITCSNSSTVLKILWTLHATGYCCDMYVIRSVDNGVDYSESVHKACAEFGTNATIIEMEDIKDIDNPIIITGADTVTDSSVVNGTPSLRLAEYNQKLERPIPFMVAAESFKYSKDKPILVNGCDLIPRELITQIISDDYFNIKPTNVGR